MRKLLNYLSPFAPDQSGAVSALFECGGLTVICDAGGCTGNICGFDEPRWFTARSAIFSAALRDMDAILGRDKALVEKIRDAATTLKPAFVDIIGTPVPAVIGTDMNALKRMTEKATGLPCFAFATKGTAYYEQGVSDAQLALVKHYTANCQREIIPGTVGLLGATPLDLSRCDAEYECAALRQLGYNTILSFGMGCGLEGYQRAAQCEKNFVVAPAGLAAARALQRAFGIPYAPFFPALPEFDAEEVTGKKILVVHQQIAANALREKLEQVGASAVTVASWFVLDDEFAREGDQRIAGEEDFATCVAAGNYDIIAGDHAFRHALPDYHGAWIDFPHFAVSGSLA
jgi:hypothetical protein